MRKQLKLIAALTLGFTVLFCVSFVYFYQRAQRQLVAAAATPKGIEKPLPEARLVDQDAGRLDDQELRTGNVVLVFMSPECRACEREAEFLKTAVARRGDVRFYGVVSYGDKEKSLPAAEKMAPFKVFYDEGSRLASGLGITRVPIKVFLRDGVIKKAWGGASSEPEKQAAFLEWLDGI